MKPAIHNLYEQFVGNAKLFGQRTAFVSGDQSWSFSDFLASVNRLSAGLLQNDLQAGDRIAILMDNRWEFLLCYGACAQLGVIAVPLNIRTAADEMNLVLKNTQPEILIYDDAHSELAEELGKNFEFKQAFITTSAQAENAFSQLLKKGSYYDHKPPTNEDGFVIIPTAATDGIPKGATLSQSNVMAAATLQFAENGREALKTQLGFLPLFHIMGFGSTFSTFLLGGKTVLMEKFDAKQVVDLILKEKVTYFGSFPPLLGAILDAAKEQSSELPSLQMVFGIEGPEMVQRLEKETRAIFWCGFGQAETTGFISTAPASQYPGSAGIINPMNRLAIMNESGALLPADEEGEIVLRGPLVFQGYWDMDKANEHVFRHGWHHTGDKGAMNAEGVLYYRGRLPEKELIKTGGENVYPKEVEEILMEHPDITLSMVFGVPDAQWGEAIKAVIILKTGKKLTLEDVRNFVGKQIAGYKRPRHVVFVDTLPMKGGKVDREKVKAQYE